MVVETAESGAVAQSVDSAMLVQSVTDYAIYMLDTNGVVTSWSEGARRFKGYEDSEIIGRHFSVFYTEEDRLTDLPRRALETAELEGRFELEGCVFARMPRNSGLMS